MMEETRDDPQLTLLKQTKNSDLGLTVFGLGAIALGVLGIYSGDFADVWQPVPASTPGRKLLAYLVAVLLVLAGVAIQSPRFARVGAITLGALYFLFGLLWLPRVFAYPFIFGTWGGVLEQFSLVAAAMVVYASSADRTSGIARSGRIVFGICVVAFAFNHFFAMKETANMVPKWIPPGQTFWAGATGVAHLLAGIAILSGMMAVVASRLLTLMMILFGALVWMPALLANPGQHMVWAGNAINLAIAGAAWVIADWFAMWQRHLQVVGK